MINSRTKILTTAIYLSFLIIVGRLFYWQVIKKDQSVKDILKQSYRLETTTPNRGKIFDQSNSPLVLNQTNYRLSIYKPNLKQPLSDILKNLSQTDPDLISQNQDLLNSFEHNSDQKWITLPTPLSKQQIDSFGPIDGLQYSTQNDRFYPNLNLAKNITGFTRNDDNGLISGYQGLEGYYNKQLSGRPGFIWSAKDATNQPVLSKKIWQTKQIPGRNLHTSIRKNIQFIIEQKLQQANQDFDADQASAIIMEPQTGQIIAMVSSVASPSATSSQNIPIDYLFEPGSIFKPLTIAIALDTNSIDMEYTCLKCNQPRKIDQFTINNWDESFHPNSNLYDIIKNSDNIALSWIIEQIGLDQFLDYFQKLQLDRKTGVDLQGEGKPILKSYWSDIDFATASFGQGFSLTQIQMIKAFNSLANQGLMPNPRLVKYLSNHNEIIKLKPNLDKRIFSPNTTQNITKLLKNNVKNSNLDHLNPLSLDICGKSGTAQVATSNGYSEDQTIASFIGFMPCDQPKLTMIVTIFNPKSSPWGASTAAPVWFDLAQTINNLL